jgi:hypothetical protein
VAEGLVALPPRASAPWVDQLLQELTSFPTGAHDDGVDALTQALRPLIPVMRSYVAPVDTPLPRDKDMGLITVGGKKRPRSPDDVFRAELRKGQPDSSKFWGGW